MDSEEEELALLCTLLCENKKKEEKKAKSLGQRDISKIYQKLGAFAAFVKELKTGEREY